MGIPNSRAKLLYLSGCQNHRCAYCGVSMRLPGKKGRNYNVGATPPWPTRTWKQYRLSRKYRRATLDHITPKSQGGTDAMDNLVAACIFCNSYRANHPADYTFSRIERLVRRRTHPHIVFAYEGRFPVKAIGGLRSVNTVASP